MFHSRVSSVFRMTWCIYSGSALVLIRHHFINNKSSDSNLCTVSIIIFIRFAGCCDSVDDCVWCGVVGSVVGKNTIQWCLLALFGWGVSDKAATVQGKSSVRGCHTLPTPPSHRYALRILDGVPQGQKKGVDNNQFIREVRRKTKDKGGKHTRWRKSQLPLALENKVSWLDTKSVESPGRAHPHLLSALNLKE